MFELIQRNRPRRQTAAQRPRARRLVCEQLKDRHMRANISVTDGYLVDANGSRLLDDVVIGQKVGVRLNSSTSNLPGNIESHRELPISEPRLHDFDHAFAVDSRKPPVAESAASGQDTTVELLKLDVAEAKIKLEAAKLELEHIQQLYK